MVTAAVATGSRCNEFDCGKSAISVPRFIRACFRLLDPIVLERHKVYRPIVTHVKKNS